MQLEYAVQPKYTVQPEYTLQLEYTGQLKYKAQIGKIVFLLNALVCLCLISCGPVYKTDYSFRPPSSSSGRACISQCEYSRVQCRQIEDLRIERCNSDAEREKALCEAKIAWKKGRDPKWYECGGTTCTADYDQCDEGYRRCYEACGGEVSSNTYCVSNCEQAASQDSSNSKSATRPAKTTNKARSADQGSSKADSY